MYKKLKIDVLGLIPLKISIILNCTCIQSRNVKKPDQFAKYTRIYKVIENEIKISIEMLYSYLIDIEVALSYYGNKQSFLSLLRE